MYKSVQFKINELRIAYKGGQSVDISSIFEEINLYDSMLLPVSSGKILITDAIGLSGKLMFDGSESILLDISKSKDSGVDTSFRKAYRIYKQTNKTNIGLNAQKYILHFVADELIYSDQQRINQSYEGTTYSKVVNSILLNYLKVPVNSLRGLYEETQGVRDVSIPNLKPLDALIWCAKRAVDKNNSPNFIFFQNAFGFNFVSLSKLLTQKDILDIKFGLKNVNSTNALLDMSGARSLEVVSGVNAIDKIRNGVDSGQFIGFDPITRMIASKKVSYLDHFNSMKHGNDLPDTSVITNRDKKSNMEMFDSRKSVSIFGLARKESNYIKKYDPTSISKIDDTENYKFQRLAILQNLANKRVRVVMPGNFQLSSGFNVNLMAPNFSVKEKGDLNEDKSISGKYIILSTRHVIGYDKHETYIELARTSSGNDFIPMSSPEQQSDIENY